MNRFDSTDIPRHASGVWIGCFAIALVEDIADNTAYLRGILFTPR